MNFLDAAYEILRAAREPLHYTEISSRALAKGILTTKGSTPAASMGSRLYVDTGRPNSRFRRVGNGVFTLAEAPSSDIKDRIDALQRQTRAELRKRLMQMPPERFEALIAELLLALGFDEDTIQVTTYTGDGGIDVRGVLYAGGVTEVNAAVQAKRWKYNVQAPVVQALRGSLVVHEQGMIITTSAFSPGAEKEARAPGKVRISLVDGEKLLDLLIKHGIGVIAEQHTVYSLDEDWWGDAAQAIGAGGASSATQVAKAAVTVAYPVPIRATAHDAVFEAKLLDAHGQVEFDGTVYRSPSGAGQKASGWKSCNGWTLWQYQNVETGAWHPIEELRAKQK